MLMHVIKAKEEILVIKHIICYGKANIERPRWWHAFL